VNSIIDLHKHLSIMSILFDFLNYYKYMKIKENTTLVTPLFGHKGGQNLEKQ
jgi:hypothetical protein